MSARTIRITLYSSIALAFLAYKYGRSLWYPAYTIAAGKKTVADVDAELSPKIEHKLKNDFAAAGSAYPTEKLCLIAVKSKRSLEVWASNKGDNRRVKSYPFTGYSGELGPKLKSGDGQIPEGVYGIEYLNPDSSYHLSAKVTYPNNFDMAAAESDGRGNLGGDIFIHGKSATIGCIPIGDPAMEELFLLIHRTGMHNVKVIIAPNDLRSEPAKYQNPALPWLSEKYQRIKSAMSNFSQ